ncbi:hypothetical protein MMC28_007817 [Mycoblastus sanguinarius]|nr:hypothetical protein [Mycoblastus sanguinarius]
MADLEQMNQVDVTISAPYSISKGAANVMVAKYSASYKTEGILFTAISPGFIDTGNNLEVETSLKGLQDLAGKLAAYAPYFKTPITPKDFVNSLLKLLKNASIEKRDRRSFVSHLGNTQWL